MSPSADTMGASEESMAEVVAEMVEKAPVLISRTRAKNILAISIKVYLASLIRSISTCIVHSAWSIRAVEFIVSK